MYVVGWLHFLTLEKWPSVGVPALAPAGCLVGPGLGTDDPRCQPPASVVFTQLKVPQYVCPQCLCLQGELQPPPTSPGDSSRPAGRSGPGSYQITAFALGPRVHEILCAPFKSEVSYFPSPVGLLQLSPAGFQSQMLWGLILLVLDLQTGEPDVGLRTLTAVGEPLQYNYSPGVCCPPKGEVWNFDYIMCMPLLSCWGCFF